MFLCSCIWTKSEKHFPSCSSNFSHFISAEKQIFQNPIFEIIKSGILTGNPTIFKILWYFDKYLVENNFNQFQQSTVNLPMLPQLQLLLVQCTILHVLLPVTDCLYLPSTGTPGFENTVRLRKSSAQRTHEHIKVWHTWMTDRRQKSNGRKQPRLLPEGTRLPHYCCSNSAHWLRIVAPRGMAGEVGSFPERDLQSSYLNTPCIIVYEKGSVLGQYSARLRT